VRLITAGRLLRRQRDADWLTPLIVGAVLGDEHDTSSAV
jgi:hypothetical protein